MKSRGKFTFQSVIPEGGDAAGNHAMLDAERLLGSAHQFPTGPEDRALPDRHQWTRPIGRVPECGIVAPEEIV